MALTRLIALVAALTLASVGLGGAAFAQSATPIVASSCGTQSLKATNNANPYEDTTGLLCVSGGGGGGGSSPSTPVATSSLATAKVVKASAGTLYSFEVNADSTLSAATWYVLILNSATDPGNGAVTPLKCYQQPAGATQMGGTFASGGLTFSTGITIVASTTGCFTETQSAHAFISGDAI